MLPRLISGGIHQDPRGVLRFNNEFDASTVRRIYFIQNASLKIERGWQGHKIEERFFVAVQGKIKVNLIRIDDWESPSSELESLLFELDESNFSVLHVPPGYVSCLQSLENEAKLMVMANYKLGECNDEYRFPLETFKRK